MYIKIIKRILDLTFSLIFILILIPIFLIFFLIIFFSDPGPIFFSQDRIGKNKKIFKLYKFRTMKINAPHDVPTHLLQDPDKYITKFGKILRSTSLDELPQILNILFGQMSFVGPRPALWNQNDLVMERDKYGANDIMPGLTGWAQVNGRDELPIEVKAKYDGEYAKKMSLFFDIKCIFLTIKVVITHNGIKEGANK